MLTLYKMDNTVGINTLIGPTGVHLMLLVSDSVSDTWQDQLLMVEKNVQISSNLAEVNINT
jgi:hypothetical protein